MTPEPLLPLLALLRSEPSRTWSIVITIYGDAVLPRGGALWLGTLRLIFEALGIGEGVVRTAVSRLAADGWLERSRIGRNSFYRLGGKGRDVFAEAEARIYGPVPPQDDARFTLVLDGDGQRAALLAAGFGQASAGVWLAPSRVAAPHGSLALRAEAAPDVARLLAAQAFALDRLQAAYQEFVSAFTPLAAHTVWSDLDAMLVRILLIHAYRRIVLRDPLLPAAMLPPDWPGASARALCARLYPRLLPGAERWLDREGRCESGELPPPNPELFRRLQP